MARFTFNLIFLCNNSTFSLGYFESRKPEIELESRPPLNLDPILFLCGTDVIAFSSASSEIKKENPVKFIETFLFQYLNPKGVSVAIIVVSNYVELGSNYINYATQVVVLAFLFSSTSITLWTFIGKFLRKFATNEKFIKYFNYAMSVLLLLSIITFYI